MTRHRVGLIGAGGISEWHVEGLKRVPNAEIIGVFDLDEAKAEGLAQRFGFRAFPTLQSLSDAGTTSVHVLTPPSSHARVAIAAMRLGNHVLVEKPLATSVEDCQAVLEVAQETGRIASVNHSLLYDPQIVRAREVVRSGRLGDVVSVDFLRGSAYPPYAGGTLPPQYRDPAYPFRDLGVHSLYVLQEFLGPIRDVQAMWESRGGDRNLAYDEWRALVRCRDGLGQFQLSWNAKPMQSQLLIHGTRGVLRVDLFLMFHALRASTPLPKAAERIVNALTDSVQPLVDVPVGVAKFVRKEVRPFHGVQDLIGAYYRALDGDGPLPVTLEDATEVVKWVEQVAEQAVKAHAGTAAARTVREQVPVLVTGAAGGVGSATVAALLERGGRVRVLVRREPATVPEGMEIVVGDLGDPDAVERAVRGARKVIHVGAAMRGGWDEHRCGTIVGTQNVLDSCARHGVEKLVHISSMSVVQTAGEAPGANTDEDTPYEARPAERGFYTQAKLEAERLVRAWRATTSCPTVILRPGQIFGGSIPLLTPAVARRVGSTFVVLGDGRLRLPLVYLDDVVQAILLALDGAAGDGEVLQLIDPTSLTQNEVLARLHPGARVVRVPREVVFTMGKVSEVVLGLAKRQSPVAEYRLRSALADRRFESERARQVLGWTPRVGVLEGIRRIEGRG